jgi:large subunit ribosomal protein L21
MYAIVKTGGKQYRVEQGQSLLVERLPVPEGDSLTLDPLLFVDGSKVVDQVEGLSSVTVEARVVGHERGPKLRVVKFKPKRGYKRRTGHRQELTRIEVVGIKLAGGRSRGAAKASKEPESPAPVAAERKPADAETKPAAAEAKPARPPRAAKKPDAAAEKPETAAKKPEAAAEKPEAAAEKPKTPRARAPKKTSEEASDGS